MRLMRDFVPALLCAILGGCGDGASFVFTVDAGVDGCVFCAPPGCRSASECDDKIACTIDTCSGGACRHAVGPAQGPTACPARQFCVLGKGCVFGRACGADADCADKDPCTVAERCQAATAICTYAVLDNDHDGHPPGVCGGADCDDADADRFPGNVERCDGKDNGCSGQVDVGATCANQFMACHNGTCACKPEYICGGRADSGWGGPLCIDRDPGNCGKCGNACPMFAACSDGACKCPQGTVVCGNACTDLRSSANHCGRCNMQCGDRESCSNGTCQCVFGTTSCGGECVNVKLDRYNCGACGKACPARNACQNGTCLLACGGLVECDNLCKDQACSTTCLMKATVNAQALFQTLARCLRLACPSEHIGDVCYEDSNACTQCWKAAQSDGGKCRNQIEACWSDQ